MRRVLLAMMFAGENRLLLLDEPAEALDITAERQLYRTLRDLCERSGSGILLVSHKLDLMLRAVHRLLLINCTLYLDGQPETVLQSPQMKLCFGLTGKDELH
jgi:ABC-type Mn2+/Zn2+ transport system ATPase subunit